MKVVERAQHGFAVSQRRHRVTGARRGLTRDRIGRPSALPDRRGSYRGSPGLARRPDPAAEIPGLHPAGPIPCHLDGGQKPPPPQQIHPIGTNRGHRPSRGQQLTEEHTDRLYHRVSSIHQPIRLARRPRLDQPTDSGHDQTHQIPSGTLSNDHPGKLTATPSTCLMSC